MENKLYQYLTTLSTKQLVKITEAPEDYTPEAVEVIRRILLSRNISSEEEENIRKELMIDIFEDHRKKELFEEKWKPFISLINLIKQPSLIKQDKYLLYFLIILLAVYYFIFLYTRLSYLYFEIKNIQYTALFFAAINFIQLISTPVVINLLYKKQSLGWILSTGGKTIEIVYTLCFVLRYWSTSTYFSIGSRLVIFLHILLLSGILVCLNYKQTIRILQVRPSLQRQTIFTGIIIGILYYAILEIIYR
ncbi:MAG: hypothetical protein ABUT20_51375 [Bacteroidota bacterium]